MKTQTLSALNEGEADFQAVEVGFISGGHFVHDVFTAFVSPLLPEIIRSLAISLTQAGVLSAVMQLPSLLNPWIGYQDDHRNLRLLFILAPGVTATLLSSIGLAPNYAVLVVLLLVAGFSIASFHAIAPAHLARLSGQYTGLGMSLFMGGGELGRTLGPLLAVWAVSIFTIKGIFPLALFGWLATGVLWLKLNHPDRLRAKPSQVNRSLPKGTIQFFIPVAAFIFLRGLMISSLGMYLPTLLTQEGGSLWTAGSALAIYQLAGSIGALMGGTLSDRFGRRRVLSFTMGGSSLFLLVFLAASQWLSLPLLVIIGFLNLTTQPIMLALIQDRFPENRSMANGLYMGLAFVALSATTVIVGAMGDWVGLRSTFFWCGVLSLLALPILLLFRVPRPSVQSAA